MLVPALLVIVIVNSDKCSAIRVPSIWDDSSDLIKEQTTQTKYEPIDLPQEYFQYTAKKPHFAIDVAKAHGVVNPESHYKSYPVRPYTGVKKPELGKHRILESNRLMFKPYQDYFHQTERPSTKASTAVAYEVYHPYKKEIPDLQKIYNDPVLEKIRTDIQDAQYKLQDYEKQAGKPNVSKDEYLETLEQTDRRKFPHENVPVPFEIHRPQRLPIYYRPSPKDSHRERVLNQKFKHPWNVNYAKIRPMHYRPLKTHLQRLRQHHALKYDDEKNEYPQLPPPEKYSKPSDGYDIFENGKQKYVQLRNNVDEQINKAVKENRPTTYQKLELQNNEEHPIDEGEEEFIPVKNYAQVRKSETYKHLPRSAAFDDAESLDEIRNAPRLREAVKSTKAQTVYTEEGYEDAAYDHAGEQKHASENEGHAGYLKEKELSGGKYKIPSLSASYDESKGQEYRDQAEHGKKWKNDDKDNEKQSDSEDYSEEDGEKSIEESIYEEVNGDKNNDKVNGDSNNDKISSENVDDLNTDNSDIKLSQSALIDTPHELNKREAAKVPQIDLASTFLSEDEIKKLGKIKQAPQNNAIKDKYPYYFNNLKNINKDSPLRYSENLKLIPRKSKGGTEFYDSRSIFDCSDVDEEVDVLPEKLKKKGHPDSDDSGDAEGKDTNVKGDEQPNNQHRLKGLGDKIDCFKAKYFGENPLDSPFFKEDIIRSPEPVTLPNLPAYKLIEKDASVAESMFSNVYNISDKLKDKVSQDVNLLLNSLKSGQQQLQDSLVKNNFKLKESLTVPQNWPKTNTSQGTNIYSDVLGNIKKSIFTNPFSSNNYKQLSHVVIPENKPKTQDNITYSSFQNKEDIVKPTTVVRKKRASFVYEPYKVIKDAQVQESKKTTTTGNISPLIKQLQSRGVTLNNQPVKRNVPSKVYVDIGKKEREKPVEKGSEEITNSSFVDVSIDKRRGEPRYELRHPNHKPLYTPVKNKASMSIEDYRAQTEKKESNDNTKNTTDAITQVDQNKAEHLIQSQQSVRPFFDISLFIPKLPKSKEQKPSASNTFRKLIRSKKSEKETQRETTEAPTSNNDESDEEYDEYDDDDDDDEEDEEEDTITTTTTNAPAIRRRIIKSTTTTASPEDETETPKLRLITRFRTAPTTTHKPNQNKHIEHPHTKKYTNDEDVTPPPKFREKKKKTSESTLVTDTKSYGEDNDDDMKKDEVDALIKVKQDMNEYTPQYEKQKTIERDRSGSSEENDSEEYDEDEDDDSVEDDSEEHDDDDESDEDESENPDTTATTPEPIKRTLVRTTEAPISTTEARSAKIQQKPIVVKKKIEIHKELPVNKSSPHKTQFKQDIKKVEIIKESIPKPTRKPAKNVEALELYKDDKLAEEINKLGAVEVFKQNLDLNTGPKHGGNYRKAQDQKITTQRSTRAGQLKRIKDTDTSESESTRLIELSDTLPAIRKHGGHLKSILKIRSGDDEPKHELSDENEEEEEEEVSTKSMHGGNLKANNQDQNKSAKLIELEEESDNDDDDEGPKMHGGNFKSYDSSEDKSNYRNAKIVKVNSHDKKAIDRSEGRKARQKAAGLLNSFAQAVPILTTAPPYILDPSKRMYYYVDT